MKTSGFTLLEVMVALVIFVMIGMSAPSLLNSMLRSQQVFDGRSRQLEGLQSLLLMSQHDLMQMVPRTLTDPKTGMSAPFYNFDSMSFVRQGWGNPLGNPRSSLARVHYGFENGIVTRELWLAQSKTEKAEFSQPLADQINHIQMVPKMQAGSAMPSSVEMFVTFPDLGEIRQLIPVVSAP